MPTPVSIIDFDFNEKCSFYETLYSTILHFILNTRIDTGVFTVDLEYIRNHMTVKYRNTIMIFQIKQLTQY